ncbi:MAG: flagellar basal body-associated FliL family protein [Pseudomonadota bacterium]
MAEANQKSGAGTKKWLIILIVVVLLLAIGGGVAAFLLLGDEETENLTEETVVEKKVEKVTLYHPLDPSFIINFDSGGGKRARLLQVSMTLLLSDERAVEFLTTHDPMIRNNILLVLSAQDPEGLLTAEGKEQLRLAVLAEVKKVRDTMGAFTGGIDDLFFTSFVMQ